MKVGLFVTCLVDLARPSIGFSTLKLLEDAGCEVIYPATQTCCGQPGYNSGARDISKDMARKLLAEFRECDYVVAPSGSCTGQIKVHYPNDLFHGAPEQSDFEALASKTFELSDFLINVLNVKTVSGQFSGMVTYHDSCSGLRELSVKMQPRYLLQMAGAEIAEMSECEKCCGFGGTFSIKLGEISTRMAENKCANIRATGASTIVGGDLGCLLNIEGSLRRNGDMTTQVKHFAEIVSGNAAPPSPESRTPNPE